jgi:hypothetical protein
MLLSFEEPERLVLRGAIAEVGLAKATVVAPTIERLGEWKTWCQLALQCSTAVLQARVSEALEALPRGREASPPGERFRRDMLAAMPDIEAMELVERFFAVGQRWWVRRIRWRSSLPGAGSACPNGRFKSRAGDGRARITTTIPRTRKQSFAHVGKVVERQNAEKADLASAKRQPTAARGRPASARPPGGKLGRVGVG